MVSRHVSEEVFQADLDRTRFRVVDEAGASSDVSSEEIFQLCFARVESFSSLKSHSSLNVRHQDLNRFRASEKARTLFRAFLLPDN
jgi:hypothetical protein